MALMFTNKHRSLGGSVGEICIKNESIWTISISFVQTQSNIQSAWIIGKFSGFLFHGFGLRGMHK